MIIKSKHNVFLNDTPPTQIAVPHIAPDICWYITGCFQTAKGVSNLLIKSKNQFEGLARLVSNSRLNCVSERNCNIKNLPLPCFISGRKCK